MKSSQNANSGSTGAAPGRTQSSTSNGAGTGPRPPKPKTLSLIPEAIPEVIRAVNAWVGWKWARDKNNQKWTKVPVNIRTGGPGSSTDSKTWTSFEEAVAGYKEAGCDGIGWCIQPGWVGIDLDGVLDKDGSLRDDLPWAADVLNTLKGFADVSITPSGTGLRLITMGTLPLKRKSPPDRAMKLGEHCGYEMYGSGRYLTMTGHSWETSSEPNEAPVRLKNLHARLFPAETKPTFANRLPVAKSREIKMFFEDPDFMDQACKLTYTSPKALNILQLNDFKARPGLSCFNQRERSIVANVALEHFNKHGRPAGKLITTLVARSLPGDSDKFRASTMEYLIHLETDVKAQRDAVLEQVERYREQVAFAQFTHKLLALPTEERTGNHVEALVLEILFAGSSAVAAPTIERASDLVIAQIDEPPYVFCNLMPSSELVMISGRKNAGKTTLAIQVALSIARGEPFLGYPPKTTGPVLYVSFEESRLDFKTKLKRLLGTVDLADDLEILCAEDEEGNKTIPKLDRGGLIKLQKIIDQRRETGVGYVMVVIDHLIAAYGAHEKRDIVRGDYEQLAPLRALALRNRLAVLLLHHNRKAESNDFLDEPAGNIGVTAGAGAIWVLQRPKNTPDNVGFRKLCIIGRRVDEAYLHVELTPSGFERREEGAAVTAGVKQRELVELLKKEGPLSPKTIAAKLKQNLNAVNQILYRARRRDLIEVQKGMYSLRKP
jgi:hypothetical protein